MGKPWKELEKKTASVLGGVRINRALDYGVSDVDVLIPDLLPLRVDCKYRARHAHHSLMEEIRDKYCSDGQFPVLVTKHHSSHREYVTCDLVLFGAILELLRRSNQTEKDNEDKHVSGQGS